MMIRLVLVAMLAGCAATGEQLCERALDDCDACGWYEGGGFCGDIDPDQDCSTVPDDSAMMTCLAEAIAACDEDAYAACYP